MTDTAAVQDRLADGSLRSTTGLGERLPKPKGKKGLTFAKALVKVLQNCRGGDEASVQHAVRKALSKSVAIRPTFFLDRSAAALPNFDGHRPDFLLVRHSGKTQPHDVSAFVELKTDNTRPNLMHAQALRRIDWLLRLSCSRVRNVLWVCTLSPTQVVLYRAERPSVVAAWSVDFELLALGSDEASEALRRFFFATHADLGSFLPPEHGPLDLLGAGSTGAVFSLKSSVLKCSADTAAIDKERTTYSKLNAAKVSSVFTLDSTHKPGCLYLSHAIGTPLRSVLSDEDLEAAGVALFEVLAAGVVQRDVRAANFVRVSGGGSTGLRLVDFASAASVSRDPAVPSKSASPDGTFVTASDAVLDAFANETTYMPHPRDDWVSLLRMALYSRCPGIKQHIQSLIKGAVHPATVAMAVKHVWSHVHSTDGRAWLGLTPGLGETASAVLTEAHALPANFDRDSGMALLQRLLPVLPPADATDETSPSP